MSAAYNAARAPVDPRAATPRGPPRTVRLRERAYASFTQHLLAANIRPGQFVSQRELVALTGLPLGAIRELIPRLEAEGLVQTVPQRGMQIASVDVALVRNAFQLRLMVEREAVAQFTLTAPAAVIAELEAGHRAVLRRTRGGGVSRRLLEHAQAVDWRFHDTLVDGLENELIARVYRVNSIRIRLIGLARVRLSPPTLSPTMHEHLAIIAAFRRRDPRGAVRALEHHLAHARSRAMEMT